MAWRFFKSGCFYLLMSALFGSAMWVTRVGGLLHVTLNFAFALFFVGAVFSFCSSLVSLAVSWAQGGRK
jgi:hypothetical protein